MNPFHYNYTKSSPQLTVALEAGVNFNYIFIYLLNGEVFLLDCEFLLESHVLYENNYNMYSVSDFTALTSFYLRFVIIVHALFHLCGVGNTDSLLCNT